jgi:hypothetical protein
MDEAAARAKIVAEARSWIGTPYHPSADIKGVGVDCGMILVRVYVDLGLVAPFDPRPYPKDWHLHRGEERYLQLLLARTTEVAAPAPGDVALFKYGRCYSHGGIVAKALPLTLVHAFAPYNRVIEEEIARNADVAARLETAKFASWFAAADEGVAG